MAAASAWNSLEIAKLVVAGAVPVAVAVVAYLLNRALRRAEGRQWFGQKLVEKRIELLSQALPDLNDVYCYFAWVGRWKEFSPPDILLRKRRLDQLFHANSPFFSASALPAYEDFLDALFETFVEPGRNARLRTGLTSQHGSRVKAYPGEWEARWNDMFSPADARIALHEVKAKYEELTTVLSAEVGA
ncbi:hypothetical protein Asp14428_02880 [Actinoplanes sp. NBRC 14428]|nr:hypothetical protein Asp14428_02880 [Actinoplanes sp. NBRC 14428]